jgi:hypothetical protein
VKELASTLTIGRCCRQVPMAISTLSTANEAPTISPETVPHSNHQHLSSELAASGRPRIAKSRPVG